MVADTPELPGGGGNDNLATIPLEVAVAHPPPTESVLEGKEEIV